MNTNDRSCGEVGAGSLEDILGRSEELFSAADVEGQCDASELEAEWNHRGSPLAEFVALSPTSQFHNTDYFGKILSEDPLLNSPTAGDAEGILIDHSSQALLKTGSTKLESLEASMKLESEVCTNSEGTCPSSAAESRYKLGTMNANGNAGPLTQRLEGSLPGDSGGSATFIGAQNASLAVQAQGDEAAAGFLESLSQSMGLPGSVPSVDIAILAANNRQDRRRRRTNRPSSPALVSRSISGSAPGRIPRASQGPALTEEELKRIRRVKNRASVEKCRTKQRKRMEALERELGVLQQENRILDNVTANITRTFPVLEAEVLAITGQRPNLCF